MRYLLFIFFLITFSSCGQRKGCTNEFASNFDNEAEIDCCCEYAVQAAIDEIIGIYDMKETCSGTEHTYSVSIKRSAYSNESIVIENFNDTSYPVEASWANGEFDLKNAQNGECSLTLSGSVHKASDKLFFIYASFPNEGCAENGGKTCEARSI